MNTQTPTFWRGFVFDATGKALAMFCDVKCSKIHRFFTNVTTYLFSAFLLKCQTWVCDPNIKLNSGRNTCKKARGINFTYVPLVTQIKTKMDAGLREREHLLTLKGERSFHFLLIFITFWLFPHLVLVLNFYISFVWKRGRLARNLALCALGRLQIFNDLRHVRASWSSIAKHLRLLFTFFLYNLLVYTAHKQQVQYLMQLENEMK